MNLEEEFNKEMRSIVEKAIRAGYTPQIFIRMLDEYGEVETAKRLLATREPQAGLDRLWEMKMLDQSMEAKVVLERFKPLFTELEVAIARERLTERNYTFQERH